MVRSIANAYRAAYSGLSIEIWVLSAALFVNRCGAMVLAFMTLYLTNELGFSMFEAGEIFSIYGLGSMAGAYLGGRLVKPLGAIRTQIVGLALSVPILMTVPFFTSWWSVALVVFLFSVCTNSVRPANSVAVAQFAPADLHARAFGLQRMAVNLGFSIGPAIGGVLATYDFHLLFIADAITTGLGALVLLWHFGFRKYAKCKTAAAQQKLAEQNQSPQSPLSDHFFIAFLLLMVLAGTIFFQFHATYPKYLEVHYSLTKPMIGLLFSVNTILIVIVEMLLLQWVKRFGLLKAIAWGGFLICIGFGILPFGNTFMFAVLSMTIITLGEMFMLPLGMSFVARRSTGRDQGMYMSWYAMSISLSSMIAPLIGTLTYQFHPHLFWYATLPVSLVMLAGFYSLQKCSQQNAVEIAAIGTGFSHSS